MIKQYPGIYRAIVKDNKDPLNLRRIKVVVPQVTGLPDMASSLGKNAVTDWIYPVVSTKRPPAVGSGVYIFYTSGDPEFPVWIGEFSTPEKLQGVFCYGSWYSTADQTAGATNTEYIMTMNNTDYQEGINLKDNSKFTVELDATYNIQFSAQVHHRTGGGGGSGDSVWIWLKKNGTAVPNSATKIYIPSGKYAIAAWNFYSKLKKNDYLQLAWKVDTVNIALEADAASSPAPAVPSVIVTMNQIA